MYQFIYLNEKIIDFENKEVHFECNGFHYFARCFQNIVQYIKGERPESYMSWTTPPTEEEIQSHEDRRHLFNSDHSIVQDWLDSL